ncbi:MAG TPA: rhomboid family intramembrane serine protease [Planctomycetota bacterium]|nr:rhomboid family intramembrane serine protease [Planctomycetota bacterium]
MILSLHGQAVTYLLMAASIVVSLYAFSQSQGRPDERFLFMPYQVSQGRNLSGMLLSQFSHGDSAHLIFNMLTLYFFGPVVESWQTGLGPAGLLAVYVAAAVGSTLLTFAIHRADPGYRALGASGAITGVLFAAIVLDPTMSVYFAIVPLPIPAPIFAVGYITLSLLAARRGVGNIGHEAHIGGAVTGFLLAGVLSPDGFGPVLSGFGRMLHR